MQLQLFDNKEFLNSDEIIKREAMEYTAKQIHKRAGHRKVIDSKLSQGDQDGAFQEFNEAYRTFGFGHMKYSFDAYRGKGKIEIRGEFEFGITSRELFNTLLELIE